MTTWNLNGMKHHMLICNGGSCLRQQGEEVTRSIREEISRLGGDALVHTTRTRCNGRCSDACVVIVYPEGVWYKGVTPETGKELVQFHLLGGSPPEERLLGRFCEEEGFVQRASSEPGTVKKSGAPSLSNG